MGLAASLAAHAGTLHLDAALSAEPGKPVALIGANAAGKTTLLRCLAGLHTPDRGRISVDGEVWYDSDQRVDRPSHRRAVGVVPQHGVLFPHLDVEQNVAYGLRAARVPRAEAHRRTGDALERYGLVPLARRRTDTLSGGERQRVALARATVLDPALLLLDEPLSALDAASRATVRSSLRDLLRERSACTVLVTHDARDALELAAHAVVLEAGRVVQEGAPAELAQRPRSAPVAALMGQNWLTGTAAARDGEVWTIDAGTLHISAVADAQEPPSVGAPAYVLVDPRDVTLHREHPEGSAQNVVQARVAGVVDVGGPLRVTLDSVPALVVEVTARAVAQLGIATGAPVWASFKATAARAFA
ncbi:MAG TPA: ABC transporter ATP-binding protein [Candidatus Angelobacter sp.]|nr:ABC transporter ATP-binding protein [Candidatus Angelobacter sp.]